ncbi:MAG: MBL fold metallo-hydrolase [Rhodospirillaceae bacterium]|nr:MBL fold metallo-hydrolase [Rhodospirillaceae bacterium]
MKARHNIWKAALVTTLLSGLTGPATAETSFGGFTPPSEWLPPPVHPQSAELNTNDLSPGVYALLSTRPPVDNGGFIVGTRGVLVIDAHINATMANKIQAAVRRVTDKPILYLVNTNAHGDHTFGNYAFPKTTTIIAHRKTAEAMRHFEEEKRNLLAPVNGDRGVYADAKLRLPDVVYDKFMQIDLGGRIVQLHHFGHGNTPGDTVVYSPDAKAAWTGNMIFGTAIIPWAIEGKSGEYLKSVARMKQTLDIKTIVPGHGVITNGTMVDFSLTYLAAHIETVRDSLRKGHSLDETLALNPLEERFLPPKGSPLENIRPLTSGFHRWNIKKTYLELSD